MSAVETRRFSCGGASFSFQVWKAPAAEASAADLAPDEGCAIAAACRESAVPLILLHGFAQSSASWNATASELAATGRPVYALDLVGHGGSERPANPRAYALDAQGEALLAFARLIADVEGVRPAVLGYSMGGRVTLAALRRDPRAFSAVILEAAGFGSATQAEREAVAKRDAACATRLRADGTPLLYLAGERDEKYRALAAQAAEAGATVCIIPGAGHNAHLEAPATFAKEVASFLRK